jgi:hypothetical protein
MPRKNTGAFATRDPGFTWEEMDALRARNDMTHQEAEGFTVREYAERYGIPYPTAINQIERLVQAGKLIRQRTKRPSPEGTMRNVYVHRPA